jgi:signal transduction histidine kinase/ligand-binding sensor domain-containing protein
MSLQTPLTAVGDGSPSARRERSVLKVKERGWQYWGMVWRAVPLSPSQWKAKGPSLLCSCVLLLFSNAVCAVTNAPSPLTNWVTQSWQTKDGLPQNTVYALLQTRDGYLWVGTGGGLARFDGVQFRRFGLQDGLRSIQISALVEDSRGELWVGTRGGGLSRWEKGHFATFSEGEGFTNSTVEALAAGRDGTVWIGTTKGLVTWRKGVFTKMGGAAGLPETQIRALLEDSKGVLWASFSLEGLYRATKDRFERVEATTSGGTAVYSLCEDRTGAVWAGGGNGFLWKFSEGTSQRFNRTNGVPFQAIECLAQGKEGPLWIGTRDGGLHFFTGHAFQKVPADAGLSGNTVPGLVVDSDGAVWAGTVSGGLNRLSPKLLHVWGAPDGLEHRTVTSIAEDGSGGLWVSTLNGGVYRFQEGRFNRVKEPSVWGQYPNAYTILATADGSVWAAGESFLYRFQPDRAAKAYLEAPVRGEAIRAMCEDEQGILLGTYYSTLLRADTAGVHVVMTNGSLGGEIRSLVREGPESLWIGTAAGLYHWDRGTLEARTMRDGLFSEGVQTLHLDRDGTLWIGTMGGGLARLKDGHIIHITSREGLADDVVSQILLDDFGYLWLGCNRGIMRLDKGEIDAFAEGRTSFVHASLLGQNEGMLKEQCASGHSPTALKTKGGRLLFPTSDGIVEIDPRHWLDSPAVIPEASIEEVWVDGEKQGSASRLVVPPDGRRVEVQYAAPSLRGADWVRYRFRLHPLEQEWVQAGTRRTAYYPGLRPGEYQFEVTACDNLGQWNQKNAVLGITVQPHYWQTLWFQMVMLLALSSAGLAWYFRRIARAEERRAVQEAFTRQLLLSQEGERKRVAAELHDSLGQDLLLIKNRVGLLAAGRKHPPEVASQLVEISMNAARALAEVRSISHALRPSALEQVGLTRAIEWMVEQISETSPTKFSTELESIDGLLQPEMEINLYRIVQEALNNLMKHAQASEVIVETRREQDGIVVSVFDNGRGFEAKRPEVSRQTSTSFGLAGMTERAKVLGGRIEFHSSPGKGTRVTLTIPVNNS